MASAMVRPRRAPRSSYLKLQRAKVHYEAFRREAEDFFKPDPTPFFDIEVNPDDGVIRVRVKKSLPFEWGPLIGDCIYNLRSALDHLVWATIVKHGGTPTPRTEFPIFLDPGRYSQVDKKGRPVRGSGLAKLEGLPTGAKDCIERLQPYHGTTPDLHPLWLLHEISNYDKHMLVNLDSLVTRPV